MACRDMRHLMPDYGGQFRFAVGKGKQPARDIDNTAFSRECVDKWRIYYGESPSFMCVGCGGDHPFTHGCDIVRQWAWLHKAPEFLRNFLAADAGRFILSLGPCPGRSGQGKGDGQQHSHRPPGEYGNGHIQSTLTQLPNIAPTVTCATFTATAQITMQKICAIYSCA